MPPIHGLTVCVDYAEEFSFGLPFWLQGLTSLTVVTTPEDWQTADLCAFWGVLFPGRLRLFRTDAFTRDGAAFNKGLAMEEARVHMPWEEWVLFFDADIVPLSSWPDSCQQLQMGYLYGAPRLSATHVRHLLDVTRPFEPDDRIGYGYFQLFHSQDPKVQARPLLETGWRHAGNYDSAFLARFRGMVKALPIPLWHLGGRGHWFGRGNEAGMRELQRQRRMWAIHPGESLLSGGHKGVLRLQPQDPSRLDDEE